MKNKGFSLTEIMVVVLIIGILTSIVTVNLSSAKVKGRDSKRQSDMEAMAAALEIYYAQNKAYPIAKSWNALKDVTDTSGKTFYPTYISSWPADPKTATGTFPKAYIYYYASNDTGSMFVVDARLEGKGTCDSSIVLNDPINDSFYKSGLVCADNDKNHYRVVGR
ncbi:MAG: type II secretory pathway, component OutG [uncultured bacterium]|nr:MAG: type II secretory pathway, component OutG [uncultured bacterium]